MVNESHARLTATLTLADAADGSWDVVIIGAGPAGSIAAREAARLGASALLVDRVTFPRWKVCGCCLNGAALDLLAEIGLRELPAECGALSLRNFQLASQGHLATVPLFAGVSLSREQLDTALIESAVASGAAFLGDTQALVRDSTAAARGVLLKQGGSTAEARAKVVVVAGGLGCRVFADPAIDLRQAADSSRIGAGTALKVSSTEFEAGTIYMGCHRSGYVGLVRLEDERLDVAAALDRAQIKQSGGIGALVEEILDAAGLPVPRGVAAADWQGTARLTQQRQHAHRDRLFVVGDAAGYVEPFTGEGIAWALATGRAVVPFALASCAVGTKLTGPAWQKKRHQLLGGRIRLCHTISGLLRYPSLVSLAVRALSRAPGLAKPMVKALNRPFATSDIVPYSGPRE